MIAYKLRFAKTQFDDIPPNTIILITIAGIFQRCGAEVRRMGMFDGRKVMRPYEALLALPMLLAVGVTDGAEVEASRLVEQCKLAIGYVGPAAPEPGVAMDIGFCFGVMDGLRGGNYLLKRADPGSAFCEPANFDNGDLAKTFIAGVGANPRLRDLRGALAAQVALRAAYPCQRER